MKKGILLLLVFLLTFPLQTLGSRIYKINGIEEFMTQEQKDQVKLITQGFDARCKNVQERDYPTIFIPGIGASWYSEYGYDESKIKRWIPDPLLKVYDPLFYTFKQNGYTLEDVFYEDEFNVYIDGNPKGALYLFGYDWKKDNTVTATLLTQLIGKILDEYEQQNGCDIGKVNIVAHSMGGLVARSMLEDMCVEYEKNGQKLNILNYYEYDEKGNIESLNGELRKLDIKPCTNPINPYQPLKVHKLITIGTPHRGAPKSLLGWEKGDLGTTDGFGFEFGIKTQLTAGIQDIGLYKVIHGYSEEIPNGIVTLGQLLPDISFKNTYNDKLQYIVKPGYTITEENYPRNSFLEELNKKENIDKTWNKLDQFILYYANITGNNGKNNVTGFELSEKKFIFSEDQYGNLIENPDGTYKTEYLKDSTHNYIGRDIYEHYPDTHREDLFLLDKVLMNDKGLGGDGTVPSLYSRLIPNNTNDGKEIVHEKFLSREVVCYDASWKETIRQKGAQNVPISKTYVGIGDGEQNLEICQHTQLTTAVSQKVIRDVLGKSPISQEEENKLLWNFIGYTKYIIDGWIRDTGILNTDILDTYFQEKNYAKPRKIVHGKEIIPLDFTEGAYKNAKDVFLRYDILSPINLLITDSKGHRIGIDPETGHIINEIPGAWTSGDTEGSNEPEFFLIPLSEGEPITHQIESFGTGDGSYHIEMRTMDMSTPVGQGVTQHLTIAGEANQGFVEEYRVSQKSEESGADTSYTYKHISSPLSLVTTKAKYDIQDSEYIFRYRVKGQSKDVGTLSYTLTNVGGDILSKGEKKVDGQILLKFSTNGEYTLKMFILGTSGNILATHSVNIHYTDTETFTNQIIEKNKIFLDIIFPKNR